MANKTKQQQRIYEMVLMAVLLAVALILGLIESMIPVAPSIPGVKMGLGNVVLLFALYALGIPQALLLMVMKVLLSGAIFGNPMMIAYSFAGGALSMIGMILLKKIPGVSILGVSMVGAVLHNVGQMALFMIIMQDEKLFLLYTPVLMLVGLITGLLTGVAARLVLKHMKIPTTARK